MTDPTSPTGPTAAAHPADAHPAVHRVRAALAERGAEGAAGGVRLLDESARTAAQAAEQLGVGVGQIANSLVFAADGAPLLVMASGGHRVDTAKVAALVGARKVRRADPEFVRAHTGFAIGGVAPVGHPEPVRTLVDRDLAAFDVLWAAAGHPHAVFPTTYDELVALTGGTPADVGEQTAEQTTEQTTEQTAEQTAADAASRPAGSGSAVPDHPAEQSQVLRDHPVDPQRP